MRGSHRATGARQRGDAGLREVRKHRPREAFVCRQCRGEFTLFLSACACRRLLRLARFMRIAGKLLLGLRDRVMIRKRRGRPWFSEPGQPLPVIPPDGKTGTPTWPRTDPTPQQAGGQNWQHVNMGCSASLPIDLLVALSDKYRYSMALRPTRKATLEITSDGARIGTIIRPWAPVLPAWASSAFSCHGGLYYSRDGRDRSIA